MGDKNMAKIKIAINGAGRIGRTLVRQLAISPSDQIELVAINNPGDPSVYAHLIKYDSVHSTFPGPVNYDGEFLRIGGKNIKFFGERDPSQIPWSDQGVQIVIDATGKFKSKEDLSKHLGGTVKKVLLCAPGSNVDKTIVMGINHNDYNPAEHHILSNASCTTNCLGPVVKVLHDEFGIEEGFMTTVHAYTSDQRILDNSHKDLRRARAAAASIIPTTTGAARSIALVIPELEGKLDGYAVRVPTTNVSLVDLTVNLQKQTTVDEVHQKFISASENELKGILKYTEETLVSCDYNGSTYSAILDSTLTNMIGKTLKITAWYDNESGFSNRVINLAEMVARDL